MPTDPFDGKQIRYSKQKLIIYSVGRNGKDSGGVSEGSEKSGKKEWREENEPIFKIPF